MQDLFDQLSSLDESLAKQELERILKLYSQPGFGSVTKRDIDIEIFITLQVLGIIPLNPDLFKVVRILKVTRVKARNLIYESELRRMNESDLRAQLRVLLLKPTFLNNGKLLYMEVENPLLQDYIKSILKTLNHITDGSFSTDIIRLSYHAYSALLGEVFEVRETNSIKMLKSYLIDNKLIVDTSIKGVISGFVKVIGKKVASESGEAIAENLVHNAFELLESCFIEDSNVTRESMISIIG